MPFESRVALRALTNQVSGELVPNLDRSFKAHEDFKNNFDEDASHIVLLDVHGFYQHVRHTTLASDIVGLTGRLPIATHLQRLLGSLMGSTVGLPQLHKPSDLLSEIYIEAPTRELTRSGLSISRFNDDFRLSVTNYGEAFKAIERVTESLEPRGLTLNAKKTLIYKRETYKKRLTDPQEIRTQIAIDNQILILSTPYEEDPEPIYESAQRESNRLAALAGLGLWTKKRWSNADDRLRKQIYLGIAKQAIRVLTAIGEPADPATVANMWHHEPETADLIAEYLIQIAHHDESAFDQTIEAILGGHLSPNSWHCRWLLAALTVRCPQIGLEWARSLNDVRQDSVRAAALLVRAENSDVDLAAVSEAFNSATSSSRPVLAAAAARAASSSSARRLRAIRNESPIISLITDANEHALRAF